MYVHMGVRACMYGCLARRMCFSLRDRMQVCVHVRVFGRATGAAAQPEVATSRCVSPCTYIGVSNTCVGVWACMRGLLLWLRPVRPHVRPLLHGGRCCRFAAAAEPARAAAPPTGARQGLAGVRRRIGPPSAHGKSRGGARV